MFSGTTKLRDKGQPHGKEEAVRALIGGKVPTEYNNKTFRILSTTKDWSRSYRIEGIDRDINSTSTYKQFDGSDISFVGYYKTNCKKNIKDLQFFFHGHI